MRRGRGANDDQAKHERRGGRHLHDLKGKVKEKTGKAVNDPNLEAEGQAEKIAGKIQKKVGQVEKVLGQ